MRLDRRIEKGKATRQAILNRALALASQIGFEGLSIGALAKQLRLSKSGLFAHFQGKENLQVRILEMAAERFEGTVTKPAFAQPRGEPRVRALFERWLAWEASPDLPGGCPFVAAASELDDRPGPARDYLAKSEKDWLELIATTARAAVREGHLRSDLDCEQFAHDVEGVILAYHFTSRLLEDPKAQARAEVAFENLITAAKNPGSTPLPAPHAAAASPGSLPTSIRRAPRR